MTAELFFKELQRLLDSKPRSPSKTLNSTNCTFTNFVYYSTGLFNCFDCNNSANGTYMYDTHYCANCMDMDFSHESELCYESVDAFKCFNCTYIDDCGNMTDSDFSSWCNGCHDVFGCFKLENKSFCIFNRQFSEAEYREKVKYLRTLPPERILAEVEKIALQHPITQTTGHDNENSAYGNYVYYSKNCYLCFDSARNEDCAYLYDSSDNKGSFDISQSGGNEISNEVLDSGQIFNSSYVVFSKNCQDSKYIFDSVDVKNSMGCVLLSHKEYCFLNRQLSKEEYEKITAPLLMELKNKYYGWADLTF